MENNKRTGCTVSDGGVNPLCKSERIFSKTDILTLRAIARHLELILDVPLPMGSQIKPYNAYRLLKRKELAWLKRKIEKWEQGNTSTGKTQALP